MRCRISQGMNLRHNAQAIWSFQVDALFAVLSPSPMLEQETASSKQSPSRSSLCVHILIPITA